MTYSYQIEDCDVIDRERLRAYRAKRSEWIHLLNGDPHHAVWRQITSMLWNDAVFRTANEARRLSRVGGYKSSARNWSIARFLDQGFVATQTLSIRKLMEKASTNPAKQVVSLRRVIDDIVSNRELITREIYVSHDGLPYDPEPGRQAYYQAALKRGSGVQVDWLPTSDDLIRPDVFERIEQELTDSGWADIAVMGNKFIAHAADEHSRMDVATGFSLNALEKCHRAICRVAATIYGPILYESAMGMFPVPQFDHFENLEEIWLKPDDVTELAKFWDAHTEKVDAWSSENVVISTSEADVGP